MEITSVNTVIRGTEKTKNANYEIECTVNNSKVERIVASFYDLSPDGSDEINGEYVGNITLDGGNISCSITDDKKEVSQYFDDFNIIKTSIKAEVEKSQA